MMAGAAAACPPCKAEADAVDKKSICDINACPAAVACYPAEGSAQYTEIAKQWMAKCPNEHMGQDDTPCLDSAMKAYQAGIVDCQLDAYKTCCVGKSHGRPEYWSDMLDISLDPIPR
jgi:hypothetical protein